MFKGCTFVGVDGEVCINLGDIPHDWKECTGAEPVMDTATQVVIGSWTGQACASIPHHMGIG